MPKNFLESDRTVGNSPPLGQVRDQTQRLHFSIRTEVAYLGWIKRHQPFHGKHPDRLQEAPISVPAGWDAYRYRRSLELSVALVPGDSAQLIVTGGSDHHRVALLGGEPSCDCADSRETTCKHEMAVWRHLDHAGDRPSRGDPQPGLA